MEQYLKDFCELNTIMKRLRSPDGCPWDRAQDMTTLCPHIIEEAYELVDAIDSPERPDKLGHIIDECGDLLLQCVFISAIAEESGQFDIGTVSRCIAEKLIRRHPSIFKNAGDPSHSADDWETIKRREKEQRLESDRSVLSGIPRKLPPAIKAFRLQGKAAGVGFDWPSDTQKHAIAKIQEELDEVQDAFGKDADALTGEVGDLLFAVINLSRRLGIDPNLALTKTNEKFENRFRFVEKKVESGGGWKKYSLEELEQFWNEAKKASL